MAGAALVKVTFAGALDWPFAETTSCAEVWPVRVDGTSRLIWVALL